jgi:mono/diheme cytochrome c family protein
MGKTLPWMMVVALATGVTLAGENQRAQITPTPIHPSMSGADIFDFYCATCHGLDGTGRGPVARSLTTPPANLTTLAAREGGTVPRGRVRAFVAHGRSDAAAHGSTEMPTWGPIFMSLEPSDALAEVRIDNVVAYIESLQR